MKTTATTLEEQIADLEKEAARLRGVHAWSQEAHIRSHLRAKRAELAAQPKPNAPNTLAWTRPLGTPAPKPTKAPKFNPWTAPLKK